MDLFRPDYKNSAFEKVEKNTKGQIALKLKTKIKITADTYIFRFEFPDFEQNMGLPVGNHIMFHAEVGGENILRKYTPISAVKDQTFVDFVIKIYRKNVVPKFPEGGLMTQYLENLEIGETMLMSGPHGRLAYEGFGRFSLKSRPVT